MEPPQNPGRFIITIDGEHSRDLDDAIAIQAHVDGTFQVRVAIANPTALVPIGAPADVAAHQRAVTEYRRDRVVQHLLPKSIAEDACSLAQGQLRDVFVFDMTLAKHLQVVKFTPGRDKIRVAARLSHEDVPQILVDDQHPAHQIIRDAAPLARLLLNQRRSRGALALFDLNQLFMSTEEGRLIQFESRGAMLGYLIVQELMVLVNQQAGLYLLEQQIPAIFRNHTPLPSAPSAEDLATTVKSWVESGAVNLPETRQQFNAIMGKALYGGTVIGHYGLNLPVYMHVTSPLRRYADLVNLRQLDAHLAGQPVPYTQDQVSAIAGDINATLDALKAARSDSFKACLHRGVDRQISTGRLTGMADHEITAAIKLATHAGKLPSVLQEELTRRLALGDLPDATVARLVFQTPVELLGPDLKQAIATQALDEPSRVAMQVNIAAQLSAISLTPPLVQTRNGVAVAEVRMVTAVGDTTIGTGTSPKKALAIQYAMAQAVCQLLGIELPEDPTLAAQDKGQTSAQSALAPGKNAKSALMEWCQQAKMHPPVFTFSAEGPPHRPTFSAVAGVWVGGVHHQAHASGATTKKEAEAQASAELMSKLEATARKEPEIHAGPPLAEKGEEVGAGNPISTLQEWAQKSGTAAPVYDFTQLPGHPPRFACHVTIEHAGLRISGEGEATSKQQAKALAAAQALLHMPVTTSSRHRPAAG